MTIVRPAGDRRRGQAVRKAADAGSAEKVLPGIGVACQSAEGSNTRSYPPSLIGLALAAGFFWYVAPEITREEARGLVTTQFSSVVDAAYRAGRLMRDPLGMTTTAFGRNPEADAPSSPPAAQRARSAPPRMPASVSAPTIESPELTPDQIESSSPESSVLQDALAADVLEPSPDTVAIAGDHGSPTQPAVTPTLTNP